MSHRAIWKFPLTGEAVDMPIGSSILAVQDQRGIPTLWALVDPHAAATEERRFVIMPTGRVFQINGKRHIGTYQQGPFVWHLFEITQEGAESHV